MSGMRVAELIALRQFRVAERQIAGPGQGSEFVVRLPALAPGSTLAVFTHKPQHVYVRHLI